PLAAITELYPLSLHDALPIWAQERDHFVDRHHDHAVGFGHARGELGHELHRRDADRARDAVVGGDPGTDLRTDPRRRGPQPPQRDRKSTRLNSSHVKISYAVF